MRSFLYPGVCRDKRAAEAIVLFASIGPGTLGGCAKGDCATRLIAAGVRSQANGSRNPTQGVQALHPPSVAYASRRTAERQPAPQNWQRRPAAISPNRADGGHGGTGRTRGGDNVAVLRAFDYCRAGNILVVDAGGHKANAIAGGIMTMASIGMAGFVLDGAIRDAAEIGERTFPDYARAVIHRERYKDGPGEINVPVSIAGMVVNGGAGSASVT